MTIDPKNRLAPSRALAHPAFWAALGLLLINDHLLKGSRILPGAITGKLSDFAGLFFAPTVLAVLLRARSARAVAACHVATGAVFSAIKVSRTFTALYIGAAALFGQHWAVVTDPTDLIALPMLWLGYRTLLPRMQESSTLPKSPPPMVKPIAMLLALFGCVATSAPNTIAPVQSGNNVLASAFEGHPTFEIDARTGALKVGPTNALSAAVVAAGVVYAVEPSEIRAVDVATRKTIWSHPFRADALGDVFVDQNILFVVASHGLTIIGTHTDWQLDALDASTGASMWSTPVNGWNSAAQALNPTTVLTSLDEEVLALDDATRREVFRHREKGKITGVAAWGGRAVAAVDGRELVVLDGAGKELERIELGAEKASRARLYVQGDMAYLTTEKSIFAADLAQRKVVWKRDDVRRSTVSGGLLVLVRGDNQVLEAFDAATLSPLWTTKLVGYLPVSPRVIDGVVIVQIETHLRAYDGKSGKLLWTFDLAKGQLQ